MLNSIEGDVDALNEKTAGYRVLSFFIIISFVAFIFFSPHGITADETDSEADAQFTITFFTGTMIDVHILVNVFKLTTDKTYTTKEIANATAEERGALKYALYLLLKEQLYEIFKNAEITNFTIPAYTNGYFYETLTVNLTSLFFGINESIDAQNFINGLLDMGANITYKFNLIAKHGWNNTFTFILPSSIMLDYANTTFVRQKQKEITWVLKNADGKTPMTQATLRTYLKNPTTHSSETEDIFIEFLLDSRSVNHVSLTCAISIKNINIHKYNVNLPSFITNVDCIPADGIRLFIENGLFSWNDVFEKTIQPIENRTTHLIENSSFNQTLDFSFSWEPSSTTNCSSPYNISQMDNNPAIQAIFNDSNVNFQICQIPTRAFFGLMNAGGIATITSDDINFNVELEDFNYTTILKLPKNITFNGYNFCSWNKNMPLAGTFSSESKLLSPYTNEHIETYIEIELLKMDLNIPSIFTGKTELTTSVKMKQNDRFYIIRKADYLSFSPKINITYLNADAFRLCVEENVFSEDQINSFLSQRTEIFEKRLAEIFYEMPIKGIIDKKLFLNSLIWDGDISEMDEMVPVIVSNYANEAYAVGFNISLWPAQLTLASQQFTLQGMENQSVTYRIIFPRGILLNVSESEGKPLILGTTNDGREYVEISFDAESEIKSTVLTCVTNVSPIYVVGLFLPCILVFILMILLVTIIYLIRKKRGGLRRGKRKLFEPEDNEPAEYSGEDYYVPPPPSSKKRKK